MRRRASSMDRPARYQAAEEQSWLCAVCLLPMADRRECEGAFPECPYGHSPVGHREITQALKASIPKPNHWKTYDAHAGTLLERDGRVRAAHCTCALSQRLREAWAERKAREVTEE